MARQKCRGSDINFSLRFRFGFGIMFSDGSDVGQQIVRESETMLVE